MCVLVFGYSLVCVWSLFLAVAVFCFLGFIVVLGYYLFVEKVLKIECIGKGREFGGT